MLQEDEWVKDTDAQMLPPDWPQQVTMTRMLQAYDNVIALV